MKAIRIPEGTWRPEQGRLFHFGTYRVPEDMPEALAQRAVAEGVAVVVEDADPAPRRKPLSSSPNKALGAAPENKVSA